MNKDITIGKAKKEVRNNILINNIDVKFREIENFENQFALLSGILNKFDTEDLQKILIASIRMQKFDAKEEKEYVAMGQQ